VHQLVVRGDGVISPIFQELHHRHDLVEGMKEIAAALPCREVPVLMIVMNNGWGIGASGSRPRASASCAATSNRTGIHSVPHRQHSSARPTTVRLSPRRQHSRRRVRVAAGTARRCRYAPELGQDRFQLFDRHAGFEGVGEEELARGVAVAVQDDAIGGVGFDFATFERGLEEDDLLRSGAAAVEEAGPERESAGIHGAAEQIGVQLGNEKRLPLILSSPTIPPTSRAILVGSVGFGGTKADSIVMVWAAVKQTPRPLSVAVTVMA
jgi:hypothetical protein